MQNKIYQILPSWLQRRSRQLMRVRCNCRMKFQLRRDAWTEVDRANYSEVSWCRINRSKSSMFIDLRTSLFSTILSTNERLNNLKKWRFLRYARTAKCECLIRIRQQKQPFNTYVLAIICSFGATDITRGLAWALSGYSDVLCEPWSVWFTTMRQIITNRTQ